MDRLVITSETSHYLETGTCPHCGRAILSPQYVSKRRAAMLAAVRELADADDIAEMRNTGEKLIRELQPAKGKAYGGASVLVILQNRVLIGMQCGSCKKRWAIFGSDTAPAGTDHDIRIPSWAPPTTDDGKPVQSRLQLPNFGPVVPVRAADPTVPSPVSSINLANYRLIGVKDERQVEQVLRTETKHYPNQSKARITPKIGITDSVTRAVTIETNNVKTASIQAEVRIVGIATIQGQIQQQLGQRYAVQVQRTLSINEEIQIEVPPHWAIELIITWKMIWLKGNAILDGNTMIPVEVPYSIPHRLTFDWVTRDVPLTKKPGS